MIKNTIIIIDQWKYNYHNEHQKLISAPTLSPKYPYRYQAQIQISLRNACGGLCWWNLHGNTKWWHWNSKGDHTFLARRAKVLIWEDDEKENTLTNAKIKRSFVAKAEVLILINCKIE